MYSKQKEAKKAMEDFRTSDLYLAATIRTALHLLPKIKPDGRFSLFIFDADPASIHEIVGQYYDDSLRVSPRIFSQNLKDLKTMLHETKQQRGGNES